MLERLKDWRNESSWQEFFNIYRRLISSFAIKSGLNSTEAEDVVQEVMFSVAKHMPTFKYDRQVGSFKGWLLNMTRWRIIDQLRKRPSFSASHLFNGNIDSNAPSCSQLPDPGGFDWEEVWDAEWKRNLLNAAVEKVRRRLPKKYQIFDFYVNKNWPPAKVANTFKISVSQVYLAKHRILELIKEECQRLQKEII